jgi:Uma2 family endonuclease
MGVELSLPEEELEARLGPDRGGGGVRVVETVRSSAEQRVLLRNAGWETYERLLAEREERRVPRFFYDRGVMEILSPSKRHETVGDIVASLVKELAVELDVDVESAGSTTFKREDLERGFEPDECFYFSGSAERVRGKEDIDLDAGDPPPDLVVEVDITNPSLDKLPIYARLGVAEVWRYAGGRFAVLGLEGEGGYAEMAGSRFLPVLTRDALARFVEKGLTTRYPDWARKVREWARGRDARSDG